MSTVVGLIHKKEIWLGGDGRASTDDGAIHPPSCQKIFRNGEYLIGFIGSARGGQILRPEYFKPPKNIFEFPDTVRTQCSEKGCLGLDENQMSVYGCNLLVVFKKKLYRVMGDFQMGEITEFAAIGSGSPYAYGSLQTTSEFELKPEERIRLAIEAAKAFDTGTGGDTQIVKY